MSVAVTTAQGGAECNYHAGVQLDLLSTCGDMLLKIKPLKESQTVLQLRVIKDYYVNSS